MVQRVPPSTQRAQQVPVGQLELGRAILAWAERALVGHGGGAEVGLDGEQAGVVCSTEQGTVVPGHGRNRGIPTGNTVAQLALEGVGHTAFAPW